MYLSRITIPMLSRTAQRNLANPYALHASFLRAFPPDIPGGGERILFRLEPELMGQSRIALVQSDTTPSWTEDVLQEIATDAQSSLKTFEPELKRGRLLRFRLRANPVVTRDGKRLGLIGDEAHTDWLRRKGEKSGFRVREATSIDEGKVSAMKRRGGQETRMTFQSVRFEGFLDVLDPDLLWAAVKTGVGPGKAFGFGLLSLAGQ
jgi:CRISPR system Cascade subunit CasE